MPSTIPITMMVVSRWDRMKLLGQERDQTSIDRETIATEPSLEELQRAGAEAQSFSLLRAGIDRRISGPRRSLACRGGWRRRGVGCRRARPRSGDPPTSRARPRRYGHGAPAL